jgi:hypothetical protein
MKTYKNAATIIIILLLIIPNIFIFITSEKPQFNISLNNPKSTLKEVKKYYHKNYGLKNILLKNYVHFKTKTLEEHTLLNQVIKGKNGWLYLGNNYNNSLNNAFGNDAFTAQENKTIINNLKNIKTYLDTKDIPFYFIIAPDKNQIYPEYLPFQLDKKETKATKLIKQIKDQTTINCFSLHNSLMANKQNSELYYKTDSHWNSYGAYVGYTEIMKEINRNNTFKIESIDDYIITKMANFNGDLSRMLLSDKKVDQITFKRKKELDIEVINYSVPIKHYKNSKGKGKLMIYKDSFTNALTPFLNNTFNEVMYVRDINLNTKLIESFKPDMIILEKIERNIINLSQIKSPLN